MPRPIKISFSVLICSIILFTSCKEKKICAAYNSYFVYDASNNGIFFTSIGTDSIPGERSADRFGTTGLAKKNGSRNDGKLNNIKVEELKKGTILPDTSLMAEDDSTGAVISTKELFPERVNTDQEAYDHYVGELMKKYQQNNPKPKNNSQPDSVETFSKPPNMTPEEKAVWKKEKKERKAAEKEAKKKAKEDALKEEDDEEDFDFDLDL